MSANFTQPGGRDDQPVPSPWVLSWDANGELANHDRYDLLQADAALDKACALLDQL